MKRPLLLLCLTVSLLSGSGIPGDDLRIMFWNLENFFDFIDQGTGESDTEFSSRGARRWTRARFDRKCSTVSKTILWMMTESGGLPDIVGMAEIENKFVVKRIVTETLLKKLDYGIVHYDSPDTRGIDCALIYRSSRLRLVSSKPCRVGGPGVSVAGGRELLTRDILLAQFVTTEGDSLAVMVNHHPSKLGGDGMDWRREVAVDRLRAVSDSLAASGWRRRIALGDFNDGPETPVFGRLAPGLVYCRRQGPEKGSIRFNGAWELIDLAFVSPELSAAAVFRVVDIPFLVERDAAHSGEKPLRTYSGPRYLGGVSDHRPILVTLKKGY